MNLAKNSRTVAVVHFPSEEQNKEAKGERAGFVAL